MKNFIKKKLSEALNLPSFRLPKNVSLSDEEIAALKAVNWSDIKIDDLGGEGNIAHLAVIFPFKTQTSNGIVIDIQVIKNTIYQIHIHMTKELQGLGLGYKIHKALINDLGHLYAGKGRTLNPFINNIWDKLKKDNDILCVSNENGDLCMRKDNPNMEELVDFIV
jgi:hypothetical protein